MSKEKSGLRLKLIDADNRLAIKYDKSNEIHTWGTDNCYPSLIWSLLGSSTTAKRCFDENAKNIRGRGFSFEGANEIVVNSDGQTINQLLTMSSKEFAALNNVFIHVNFNAAFEITSATLKACTDIRIGKADSKGYSGKFIDYPNWDGSVSSSIKKSDYILIDKFNPNPAVIAAQVEAQGGWHRYKGQLLHLKGDFSKVYSLPEADSVIFDMDSEYRASRFKNSGLRSGMWGARIMVTQPFDSDLERKEYERTLQSMMGVDDTNALMVMESKNISESFDSDLKIIELDSNFDDKRFDLTERSSARNIMTAFDIAPILIDSSDNSIFGGSGEMIRQARIYQWEKKEEERALMVDAFKRIFSRWHEPLSINDWSIQPIIQNNQS